MDTLAVLREKASRVDDLEELFATMGMQRDRKVEAQRKEIRRLLEENKRLGLELHAALQRNASTEPYKENQSLRLTIKIQAKAIQDRQDWIDSAKAKLRGLATDAEVFK